MNEQEFKRQANSQKAWTFTCIVNNDCMALQYNKGRNTALHLTNGLCSIYNSCPPCSTFNPICSALFGN